MNKQTGTCQVCCRDVSDERIYYRRNRICEEHSKAKFCVEGGAHQRWCQQCCKFQNLVDFDGERRTCRSRLDKHNERRRALRQLAGKRPRGVYKPVNNANRNLGSYPSSDFNSSEDPSEGDGLATLAPAPGQHTKPETPQNDMYTPFSGTFQMPLPPEPSMQRQPSMGTLLAAEGLYNLFKPVALPAAPVMQPQWAAPAAPVVHHVAPSYVAPNRDAELIEEVNKVLVLLNTLIQSM